MKSKETKDFENRQKVSAAVVGIRQGREDVQNLAAHLEKQADEAARLGEDAFSDELLEMVLGLEDFATDMKVLEVKLETTAVLTNTLSKLSGLPKALEACKKLYSSVPNFKAVGKSMESLSDMLDKARGQFKGFTTKLRGEHDQTYTKLFGARNASNDPKYRERLAEKKKAREARLLSASAAPVAVTAAAQTAATTPAAQTAAAGAPASVDAIAKIISDETK